MAKLSFSQTYRFLCRECNYLVETEGPWPYHREGRKIRPHRSFYEACSGPVHGLKAKVYCARCDKNREYPVVEYKGALSNLSEVWWTFPKKTMLFCRKCKGPVYLILPEEAVKCPRCKKGTFGLYEPIGEEETEYILVPAPRSPLRVRQNGKAIKIPRPVVVIDSQEHGCKQADGN